jgi:very-short-patch-repair endonuclease
MMRGAPTISQGGYTVLRFTNSDVLDNADGLFDAMRGVLGEPEKGPPP